MIMAFSTPSATTFRPRLWARSMVDRTITSSSLFSSIDNTNERSILISSTGICRKRDSDEWPVPKSSIEKLKPRLRTSDRMLLMRL